MSCHLEVRTRRGLEAGRPVSPFPIAMLVATSRSPVVSSTQLIASRGAVLINNIPRTQVLAHGFRLAALVKQQGEGRVGDGADVPLTERRLVGGQRSERVIAQYPA